MSLHVTVVDEQTGEREETRVPDGEYFILVTAPAWLAYTATYANGTHVLTIKGRTGAAMPEVCSRHGAVRHRDDPFCWYANEHATAEACRDLTVDVVCEFPEAREEAMPST